MIAYLQKITMTNDNLEQFVSTSLSNWELLIRNEEWTKAREEAQLVIDRCKSILKEIKFGEASSKRSKALVFGILSRSLQNFTDLSEIIRTPNLGKRHDFVEKAWTALCDCSERIEYAAGCCKPHSTIEWVFSEIERYEEAFQDALGPGLYFSPEILIKKETCSICGQDLRACNHISGYIYDGMRCYSIPNDIQSKSISIVEYPTDRRCRIWPWQVIDDRIVGGYILTTFSMDDFLYK